MSSYNILDFFLSSSITICCIRSLVINLYQASTDNYSCNNVSNAFELQPKFRHPRSHLENLLSDKRLGPEDPSRAQFFVERLFETVALV